MTLAFTRTRLRAGSRRAQRDHPRSSDASSFEWHDAAWEGVALPGQVLYEIHVGTFTADGTWRAAAARLPQLRELGVTVIQMMPVAEFAGDFGWGYDGVQWFAPMHTYGTPADLQHFVDTAHQLGLGVILDVVYNHLGPSGNFLPRFSPHYFTERHKNEWGTALNFDDERAHGMRELVLTNVEYWIRDFHLDGFRLDAAQQLFDASSEHILTAIARVARDAAAPRSVIVIAEHEPQHARLMRPAADGGYGLDGLFNEDFHHSTRVTLTGIRDAYLSDYTGSSREWLALAQSGFLFQGQYYPWQSAPRGAPALDRPVASVRRLHREPRPGRESGIGPPADRGDQPVVVAGDDGVLAARPVDAVAVPGPGVGIAGAVPLFRRPRPGPAADGAHRPAGVHRSVRASGVLS